MTFIYAIALYILSPLAFCLLVGFYFDPPSWFYFAAAWPYFVATLEIDIQFGLTSR